MIDAQLDLPFDEWEEWNKKPPLPVLPYFEHPANDNERLLNYQYEFRNGDTGAAMKMLKDSIVICRKFINNEAKKNKFIRHMSQEEKEERAHDAAVYLLEQMLKSEYFYVKENYPGYLYLRVLHELYYRRECDKLVEYIDTDDLVNLEDPAGLEEINNLIDQPEHEEFIQGQWDVTFKLKPKRSN